MRDLIHSMTGVFRLTGWGAVILIAVLSLVPGEDRPHVLGPGMYEHFAAYSMTSSVLLLGYRGRLYAFLITIFLSALSGIFEILQLWIPGRTSQFSDFLVSSLGAIAGVVVISVALWLRGRHQNTY